MALRMAKLDRNALESAQLGRVLSLPTRFDDVDVQGHINNAAIVVLLQEARTRFFAALSVRTPASGQGISVAGMTVEFAAELLYPDPVEVAVGVIAIGRSSFTFGQIVRQGGRNAVYAEVTMVLTQGGAPTPLTDEMRASLTALSSGAQGA
jgi:acyl-CoA thioester hydrolase